MGINEMEELRKIFLEDDIKQALNERHSVETQEKLSKGRVAIAGLGGLGSNVAFALARIGVGHLHLIDFDEVDLTNLNRQQYFLRHVGMKKTEALKEQLLLINPYLEIITDCVRVTEENLKELFRDEDIICEAFDDPDAKPFLPAGCWNIFQRRNWFLHPVWQAMRAAT